MPLKKVDAIKSPHNSRKNILLTLENEGNNEKSNGVVKKRKQCVPRSRKKEVTGSPAIVPSFQPVKDTESPAASASRKGRKKISVTKSPRNSKKKELLTESNTNVNNIKSDTTIKKKRNYVRRPSGKKGISGSPSVVKASPAASCSKKPRKKVITPKKSPRSLRKRTSLSERKVNEKNKKSNSTVKKTVDTIKHCGLCQQSGINEVAGPFSVVSPSQYVEAVTSLTASSSLKPRRKVLKNKSPRTSRKRKLSTKQKDHENIAENNSNIQKKKHCDLQSGDREDDVPFIVNISSTEGVPLVNEIALTAASSAEQKDQENEKKSDINIKKKIISGLLSADTEDDLPILGNVLPAKVAPFMKEIAPIAVSSLNSKNSYEKVRETRCMICMELLESYSASIAMSCDHSFHYLCLQTWFEVKKSCPVCNPEICANNVSNNAGVGDAEESDDMNRQISLYDFTKNHQNESPHIDKATNELRKLNEDINEFLTRCVICMGTSPSLRMGDSHDQVSNFDVMPCGHNVHSACAQTSSGIKKGCPVCMENSRIEDDIYVFPEEVCCVICLDTVESSNFEYISCCHSFHHQCIQTWFTVRRGEICPVCMVSSSSSSADDSLYGFLENVRCTICMDIEESSEFQRLSCRHSFHTMCAQSWFQENSYCPTCMRNVSLDNETDDEEEVRCVICVDTEESSVFEFLSCCHSFHAACIQSWLKKGKSCPICNTRILDMPNTVENVGCAAACS